MCFDSDNFSLYKGYVSIQPRRNEMRKFEYRDFAKSGSIPDPKFSKDLLQDLNVLGAEGWQIVWVRRTEEEQSRRYTGVTYQYLLMREIEQAL